MLRQGFDFNLFDKDNKVVGRELFSEHPYLSILMKLCHGDWNSQQERMNMKVDEVNGKYAGMVNGGYQRVRQFLSN